MISLRKTIQVGWSILSNGYIAGFFQGNIYQGKLKNVCVPGLNCYSCPGSLGSCPIGSLQGVLGSVKYKISFYLLGFFILLGVLLGRLVCGYLCPFGLIQEILHKIPFVKKVHTFQCDRLLRWVKYGVLLVFVILLPLFVVDSAGSGSPAFYKWICPVGTLEGGIPLVLSNPLLRNTIGALYAWKIVILAVTILLSIMIFRPFCKYVCPLGAIYALFNKVSVYQYHLSKEKCVRCGKGEESCPMQVNPCTETNHFECIRCGKCKKACSNEAITPGFKTREEYKKPGESAGVCLKEREMTLNE